MGEIIMLGLLLIVLTLITFMVRVAGDYKEKWGPAARVFRFLLVIVAVILVGLLIASWTGLFTFSPHTELGGAATTGQVE